MNHSKMAAASLKLTAMTWSCLILGACGPPAVKEVVPEASTTSGYAPFSASYQGLTQTRIEQTYNDQTDVNEIGMRYHLTVDVLEADSALSATLVLDSITDVSGIGAEDLQARTDSARGTVYEGVLAPNGELLGFTGGDNGGSLAQDLAGRVLESLFPRIPAEGVRAGARWSDTLETTASLGGVDNTVRSLRQHEAIGWTTYAGRRALHIVTSSSYTFSGSDAQASQEFTLNGEGRRHSDFYMGPDGTFLGFVSADTADAEAYLLDAGITIPVHQTRADSLAVIR